MKSRLQLVRLAAAILIGSMLVCAMSCGIGIITASPYFWRWRCRLRHRRLGGIALAVTLPPPSAPVPRTRRYS